MFTGLIEKIGKVENFSLNSLGANITFKADFNDIKLGSSIAINGVCLSITSINGHTFSADIMKETLNLTNLSRLKKGDLINLERAMSTNSRFDGHIVQGHIDTIAKVRNIMQDGFAKKISFICNNELIIKKGSIAINGVSLTVSDVFKDGFEVSLIPTTLNETNLSNLKQDDFVNIEFDVLGKYLYNFLNKTKNENKFKITKEFLIENGF